MDILNDDKQNNLLLNEYHYENYLLKSWDTTILNQPTKIKKWEKIKPTNFYKALGTRMIYSTMSEYYILFQDRMVM